ncbi:MAG TPA: hypothetical protein VK211_23615, partial [Kamptonema sp.]|nr:hypothetical protein [Kamptonema sp.]
MGKLSELLGETIDNQESYQKMVGLIKLALRMEGMRNLFVGVCDDTTNTKRTKLLNRLSKELSLDT